MNKAPASAGALFLYGFIAGLAWERACLAMRVDQAATSLCGSKLSARANCHIRE